MKKTTKTSESPKRKITRSSAKDKGRTAQKEAAKHIQHYIDGSGLTPISTDHVRSTPMGSAGVDIQLSPSAAEFFPFAVESKYQERWSIETWWKQTCANAGKLLPFLYFRKNRHEALVTVQASVFFELLGRLSELAYMRDDGCDVPAGTTLKDAMDRIHKACG